MCTRARALSLARSLSASPPLPPSLLQPLSTRDRYLSVWDNSCSPLFVCLHSHLLNEMCLLHASVKNSSLYAWQGSGIKILRLYSPKTIPASGRQKVMASCHPCGNPGLSSYIAAWALAQPQSCGNCRSEPVDGSCLCLFPSLTLE